MSKTQKKEMFLIISSFLMGGFLMFLWLTNSSKESIQTPSLSAVIEEVTPGVVEIKTKEGNGSGFIYKKDAKYGYILTNEHVITGEKKVKVIFKDGTEVEPTILGTDSYMDIAILRVPKKYIKKVLEIDNSDSIKVGDTIFTIGTPLGTAYQSTVTSGILSGKDRYIEFPREEENTDIGIKALQIDAPINQGNSGGPLFNIEGKVIGICFLKLTDVNVEGMAFAIPTSEIENLLETLELEKTIERPSLGIGIADTKETATLVKYDLDILNLPEGIIITEIKDNSNVEGKLQKGDIIISMDKIRIHNKTQFRYELYKHKIGDTISLEILRETKKEKISIKLKEK